MYVLELEVKLKQKQNLNRTSLGADLNTNLKKKQQQRVLKCTVWSFSCFRFTKKIQSSTLCYYFKSMNSVKWLNKYALLINLIDFSHQSYI